MSNKTTIQSHNTRLNNLLEDIHNLPEAGGIELPALDNEGAAADILSGKQLINQEGEIIEGTMPNNGTISQTIDGINTTSVTIPSGYTQGGNISLDNTIGNEVTTQTDLIAQIATVVDGLPEAGGNNNIVFTKTVTVNTNGVYCYGLDKNIHPICTDDGTFDFLYGIVLCSFDGMPSISGGNADYACTDKGTFCLFRENGGIITRNTGGY